MSSFEINDSYLKCNNTVCSDSTDNVSLSFTWILLMLACLAFILNNISLWSLVNQSKKSAMRRNLILLSLTEVALTSSQIVDYSRQIRTPKDDFIHQGELDTIKNTEIFRRVLYICSDTFACMRNYCNVLIAVSRGEVIIFPMKRWKFFSRTRILFIYLMLIVVSFGAAISRSFSSVQIFCNCTGENSNDSKKLWQNEQNDSKVETIFFVFQVMIPLSAVVIVTFLIIYQIAPWKHQESEIACNPTRRKHHKKATNTVLILAVIFTVCELPTFIFHVIGWGIAKVEERTRTVMMNVADFGMLCDSLFNIFAYCIAVHEVRQNVLYLFCFPCMFYKYGCFQHRSTRSEGILTQTVILK